MLAQIGIVPSAVIATDIDETSRPDEPPRAYAARLAAEKARTAHAPGQFTLGADTVVALGRRILPKAADPAEVAACLRKLSGRRHHVITAVTLLGPGGHQSARSVDTVVGFARLTDAQMAAYADCGEGVGKAGGYAIQGGAAAFVKFIGGSYSAVVGLPLYEVSQLLRGQGWLRP